MSNLFKTKTANLLGATLGIGHFICQSTADLILESEASIKHSLVGSDKEEVRTDRVKKTIERQMAVMDRISRAHSMINRAADFKRETAE